MAATIDERVVEMRFDNKQFEAGVSSTMSLLDKFKAKLNFKGAEKGLEDVSKAANKVDMSNLEKSVSTIEKSFSTLGIVGITVLQNITNSAIAAGTQIVKSLTITPVMSGMQEYELKLNSIQTILANVKRHGSTIDDVSKALDELNHYADLTIYNFGQMTTAIGMFTTAGVELDRSVASVKGISNLAAFVGAPAQDATRAMYQLSQALSTGTVRLQDWMSLEHTAGMAGVEFQDRLKDTARILGENVDAAIEKNGNFRESLKEGWLTTEVLTETLKQFAGEVDEIYLKQQGWNDEQIKSIMELGKTATESATIVKSFTQLLDTLAEAAQSGWAESWEIIIGNLDEAKVLWTAVANEISGILDGMSQQRNDMLRLWKDEGGRDALIQSFRNLWEGVLSVIEPVEKAFRAVFPYISGEKLAEATKGFEEFTRGLRLSEEAAYTLEVTLKVLLLPLRGLTELIKMGVPELLKFTTSVWSFLDSIIAFPSKTNNANEALRNFLGDSRYTRLANATNTAITRVSDTLTKAASKAREFVNSITSKGYGERVVAVFKQIYDYLAPVGDWLLDHMIMGFEKLVNMDYSKIVSWITDGLKDLNINFDGLIKLIETGRTKVVEFFKALGEKNGLVNLHAITEGFSNLKKSLSEAFHNFASSGVMMDVNDQIDKITGTVKKFVDALLDLTKGLTASKILVYSFGVAVVTTMFSISKLINSTAGMIENIGGVAGSISGLADAVTERIKPDKFRNIAIAITILAGALVVLSLVDTDKLMEATKAMAALMGVFALLTGALALINKFLLGTAELTKSFQALSTGLMMIAGAFLMLSAGLLVLSKVEPDKIATSMLSLIGVLSLLVAAVATLSVLAPKLSAGGVLLLAFSGSVLILVNTMAKLADVDTGVILESLNALLGMIVILMAISTAASRVKLGSAVGLIVAIESLVLMMGVLEKLANKDPARLLQGVLYSIPLIGEISLLMLATRLAGEHAVKAGVSIVAISAALLLIAEAVDAIGSLDTKVIAKGIIAIGLVSVMFQALITATKVAGKHAASAGVSIVAMSGAILILTVAIKALGGINLGNLVKGVAAVDSMLALFALIIACSNEAKGATPAIIAIAAAITALTTAIVMLTFIPFQEAMGATLVLATLMLSFAGTMKLIGAMDTEHSFKKLVSMVLIVGLLSTVVFLMSKFPSETALTSAASLALIMTSLSVSIRVMNGTDFDVKQALTNAGLMGAMLAEVTGALYFLSTFDATDMLVKATALSEIMLALSGAVAVVSLIKIGGNVLPTIGTITAVVGSATLAVGALSTFDGEGILPKATALSEVMLAMAGVVAALGAVTKYANGLDTLKMAGVFGATMLGVSAIVAAIGAFVSLPETKDFLPNGVTAMKAFEQLIPVLYAFAGLTAVLALVGRIGGVGGIIGVGTFDALILSVAAIVAALGAFVNATETQDLINKGADAFAKLGDAIGGFFGGIVGKFLSNSTEGLANAGQNVSEFAEKVTPFMNAVKDFDSTSADGVKSLVEAVSLLAELKVDDRGEQIATFVGYLDDMVDPIKAFCVGLGDVDLEAAKAAGILVTSVTDLVNIIPESGGIKQAITGTKDLKQFAEGMADIGPSLVSYYNAISAIKATSELVETSAAIAQSIASFANNIPSTGGLLQDFFGEKDMQKFGENLVSFGRNFYLYYLQVHNVENDVITASSAAAKSIAEFASGVPLSGGMLQDFFGEANLKVFGENLVAFGSSFYKYYMQVHNIENDVVTASAAAASSIAEFASKLGRHGGWVATIFGDSDVAKFGQDLVAFGSGFYKYYAYVKNIESAAITGTVSAAEALVGLYDIFPKDDPEWMKNLFGGVDMATFGQKLASFGQSFSMYYDSIGGIVLAKVENTTEAIRNILTLSNDLSSLNTQALDNFGSALESIAEAGIDGFVERFKEAEQTIKDAVMSPVNESITELRTTLNIKGGISVVFYDLGKYAVQGYINGVNSMRQSVIQLWTGIGKDSRKAIQEELDMHSPSVEFEKLGVWTIQGYLDGIEKNVPKVVESFVAMGDDAKEAGRYVVKEIADGITDEMSAEEAAEKKAQNIINAFSKAMEGFDLNIETRNKEMDLFDALFPDATEEQRLQRQYQTTSRNLEDMMEKTKLALGEFKATQAEFGDTAIETQKAHNKFLDAFNAYVSMADELTDIIYQMSLIGVNIEEYIPSAELNEVGDYFVKNIGLGITANTSAEEAAQIKADNIAMIFEGALDRAAQELEIFDLKYQIWQKENPGATEEEQAAAAIDNATEHFNYAAKAYEQAVVTYKTAVAVLGEGDLQTLAYQEEMLEKLNDLIDARDKLNELQTTNTETLVSEQDALIAYNEKLKDLDTVMKLTGKTAEEVKEAFAVQTGWNIYRDANSMVSSNADQMYQTVRDMVDNIDVTVDDSIIESFQKPVNATRDLVAESFEELNGVIVEMAPSEIEQVATVMTDTYTNTVTAAKPKMVETTQETVKDVVTTAVETAATEIPTQIQTSLEKGIDFSGTFTGAVDGWVTGLLNGTPRVADATEKMAEQSVDAANKVLGINSPSTVMYEMAGYVIDGFVLGINDGKPKIDEAMLNLLQSVTNVGGFGASGITAAYGLATKTSSAFGSYMNAGTTLANNLILAMVTSMQEAYAASKDEVLDKVGFIFEDIIRDVKPLNYESVFEHGQWMMVTILSGFWSREGDFITTVHVFIDDVCKNIKDREDDVFNAGASTAAQFAAGMLSMEQTIIDAAVYLAYQANIAFREALDINSPSGVFAENGKYVAEGFAKGMTEGAKMVRAAADKFAGMVRAGSSPLIKRLAREFEDAANIPVTLHPVVDLDDLKNEIQDATMDVNVGLDLTTNIDRVNGVLKTSATQTGFGETSSVVNYNFNQNNYSPKSLSNADIYRRTKNQFAMFRSKVGG